MSDSKDSKESKKPLVVVVGATGSQGGSVIEHLLKTKKYSLRGITRKVDGDASKKLISQGVEMAAADIRDKDALTKAFAGADFLYAVTNFWDPETMKKHDEVAQGKTLVDAAHAAGVKHIIWSGLDNVTEGSGGRIKDVHHFTGKHEVETYIKKLGLSASFVYAGFYAQNFSSFFPLKKASDDVWELTLPLRADVGIPIFDVSDTGIFVATVIANWTKYEGKLLEWRHLILLFHRSFKSLLKLLVRRPVISESMLMHSRRLLVEKWPPCSNNLTNTGIFSVLI